MKSYFIIHALGNTSYDYWYPWLKKTIETQLGGHFVRCFTPTLPPMESMSYKSWSKSFLKYKKYIDEDSVFIGHSTGAIFIVRFLLEHNLHVNKFIGVSAFNNFIDPNLFPERDIINKTFFVPSISKFEHIAKSRYCMISPTDIIPFNYLNNFAEEINAEKIVIEKGGHFTMTENGNKRLELPEILPIFF